MKSSDILEAFQKCAMERPEAVAIQYKAELITYGELNLQANRLACYLQKSAPTGAVIGLCLPRSIDYFTALLACLKAHYTYLPLDPELPDERLQYMVEDAAAKHLITYKEYGHRFPAVTAHCLDDIELQELPSNNVNVSRDGGDHPLHLIYTSGSTGRPKGVRVFERGVANVVSYYQTQLNLKPGDHPFLVSAIGFDISYTASYAALTSGATLCLPSTQHYEPTVFLDDIHRFKVTSMSCTPTTFLGLLQGIPKDQWIQLASLRYLVLAGEPIKLAAFSAWLDQAWCETKLVNYYGPTELSDMVAWHWIETQHVDLHKPVPIGKVIPGLRAYVLDEQGQPVIDSVVGELHIGGVGVTGGYLNQPQLTAERFVPDIKHKDQRMYRTGDLVQASEGGVLNFVGRADQQVKVRGFRIELGEIEAALVAQTGITEAVVLAKEDELGSKRLVAYLVVDSGLKANDSPSVHDLRVALQTRLPDYMLPTAWVFMDKLPVSSNGKIDRKALPAPEQGRPDLGWPLTSPENPLQQKLVQVWCDVLNYREVGIDDPFFELGGTSIRAVKLVGELGARLGVTLPVVSLFSASTVRQFSTVLMTQYTDAVRKWCPDQEIVTEQSSPGSSTQRHRKRPMSAQEPLAIVGMACRYPGAESVSEFWQLLLDERDGFRAVTAADLTAVGLDSGMLEDPNYVPVTASMGHVKSFDASFFGIMPKEAELMDPQHRHSLEVAWLAMENAGYDPLSYPGTVGVFTGIAHNGYLIHNVTADRQRREQSNSYQSMLGNDKDYPATRVAFKLNLTGPAVNIQTACSSTGVGLHWARRAIENGDCDAALIGGGRIVVPNGVGYHYVDGGTLSKDGKIRAFDANANGMVRGSGIGFIMVKPLSLAQEDGDTIYALVRSTAVNNDGRDKVGFTAPSVAGQQQVIERALADAQVDASQINYVEAHGTGTHLGDPIEVSALTQAYRRTTDKAAYCGLGSVKTNIGHLDAGAAVAGLIKTSLALHHRRLPATLNVEMPNPQIDFNNTPFYVQQNSQSWAEDEACYAAVSSFGLGGTNAHMILQRAPEPPPRALGRGVHLLTLSAQSESSLRQMRRELANYLETNFSDLDEQEERKLLADIAFTLQCGRANWPYKFSMPVISIEESILALRNGEKYLNVKSTSLAKGRVRKIVFLFPGQGAQYVNMAQALYQSPAGEQNLFKTLFDECSERLKPLISADLRDITLADHLDAPKLQATLDEPRYTQPALFSVCYSLARQLIAWGVEPDIMLGHSVGEYVSACLAGHLSMDEALQLVVKQAQLMESMPNGSMLAIKADEGTVKSLLDQLYWNMADGGLTPEPGEQVVIASLNSPSMTVVAGKLGAIGKIRTACRSQGLNVLPVQTAHAFHSPMMQLMVKPLKAFAEELFAQGQASNPAHTSAKILSTHSLSMSGDTTWRDADYWSQQVCDPVRFLPVIEKLFVQEPETEWHCIEVGPGQSSISAIRELAQIHFRQSTDRIFTYPSLGHRALPNLMRRGGLLPLTKSLGKLWQIGVQLDWQAFYEGQQRRRVALPGYSFSRVEHWLEPTENFAQGRAFDQRQLVSDSSRSYFPETQHPMRPVQLLSMSAASDQALIQSRLALANWLQHQTVDDELADRALLADVAYTLQMKDHGQSHRFSVAVVGLKEAIDALQNMDKHQNCVVGAEAKSDQVVFLFPGQGAQYVNMAQALYEDISTPDNLFKAVFDECCDRLKSLIDLDLREITLAEHLKAPQLQNTLDLTHYTQPALFAVSYALARQLIHWGIQPDVMIGHGVGEYVAACLVEQISLDEALKLIAKRAMLMQALPHGGMIAIKANEATVRQLLDQQYSKTGVGSAGNESEQAVIAAVNGPSLTVVSGTFSAIGKVRAACKSKGFKVLPVQTSHAFHSPMIEPMLAEFLNYATEILSNPCEERGITQASLLSTTTGAVLEPGQWRDPSYWVDQIVDPVRFLPTVECLISQNEKSGWHWIEVGPGQSLTTALRELRETWSGSKPLEFHTYPTLGHRALPNLMRRGGLLPLLKSIGRLWQYHVTIDWKQFNQSSRRTLAPLPPQCFATDNSVERGLVGIEQEAISSVEVKALSEERALGRLVNVLALTGRSHEELESRRTALTDWLASALQPFSEAQQNGLLADTTYTLLSGRVAERYRYIVPVVSQQDAVEALRNRAKFLEHTIQVPSAAGRVSKTVFLFPGQGAQYVNMAQALYEDQSTDNNCFKEIFDHCCDRLNELLDIDLRTITLADHQEAPKLQNTLDQTKYTQPALFTVCYALARQMVVWGVKPDVMIGHSVGEYVAACLAGFLSLDEALRIIVKRSTLMQSMPNGGMLALKADEATARSLLDQIFWNQDDLGSDEDKVVIAASNGPTLTVVAGRLGAIGRVRAACKAQGFKVLPVQTSHAFHSPMMKPMVAEFSAFVAETLSRSNKEPERHVEAQIFSTRVGDHIAAHQWRDPDYWANQIIDSVRFLPALETLFASEPDTYWHCIEVGPGQALVGAVREIADQHQSDESDSAQYNSYTTLGHRALPNLMRRGGLLPLMRTLGKLWQQGEAVDWAAVYAGQTRFGVPLPDVLDDQVGASTDEDTRRSEQTKGVSDQTAYAAEGSTVSTPMTGLDNSLVAATLLGASTKQLSTQANNGQSRLDPARHESISKSDWIQQKLLAQLEAASGISVAAGASDQSFVELGLDSLFITQWVGELNALFRVKLTFRDLMERYVTITDLIAHLVSTISDTDYAKLNPAILPPSSGPMTDAQLSMSQLPNIPLKAGGNELTTVPALLNQLGEQIVAQSNNALYRLMAQQLNILAQQFLLFQSAGQAVPAALPGSFDGRDSVATNQVVENAQGTAIKQDEPGVSNKPSPQFGAQTRISRVTQQELSASQQVFIDGFVTRYCKKTEKSKAYAAQHRDHLADPRVVSGFTPLLKEVTYPIVVELSQGAMFHDIDGETYLDMTCGFGTNIIGHNPEFIRDAISEQLSRGVEVGPQTPLVGEAAERLARMVGLARVVFCNTGSEAVMGAVRLARAVTGKNKVVMFQHDYHGVHDEVIVRGTPRMKTVPAAAGINPAVTENVWVLEYGSESAFHFIEEHQQEIAAVLVEPVQSRNLALQPKAFLQTLRELTQKHEIALIFDEVITGFRVGLGGAQSYFGVQADLATYGKILGGGMPIGAIAGAARFMDALDGGAWQYGDDSRPEVGVTYFAGTFVRHPLAMASCLAMLTYLEAEGEALAQRLTQRMMHFVQKLKTLFAQQSAPIRILHFASMFRLEPEGGWPWINLLYPLLRERGIHIYEGRTWFIMDAHTDDDLTRLLTEFQSVLVSLREAGFIETQPVVMGESAHASNKIDPDIEERVPTTEAQQEIWASVQMGDDANRGFNEAITISLSGKLDHGHLKLAFAQLVERQQSLRSRLSSDGLWQEIMRGDDIALAIEDLSDLSEAEIEQRIEAVREQTVQTPYDLAVGPLFGGRLLKISAQEHRLMLYAHHIVCDGWSMAVVVSELGQLYSQRRDSGKMLLDVGVSWVDYAVQERDEQLSNEYREAEKFWLRQYQGVVPVVDLPTDRVRPAQRTYDGKRVDLKLAETLVAAARRYGAQENTTFVTTLLAAFSVYLFRLTGQEELIVGIPAAGQSAKGKHALVGHCVNLLPLRLTVRGRESFRVILSRVRTAMLDAYEHQAYTFGTLVKRLKLPRDPGRVPLMPVLFNIDQASSDDYVFDGLDVEVATHKRVFENFEWTFNVSVNDQRVQLECTYNTNLFDEGTVDRRLVEYAGLLKGLVEHNEQPVGTLPIISTAEMKLLDSAWNHPQPTAVFDSIADQIAAVALKNPESIAVRTQSRSLTYEKLDREATQLANYLLNKGVEPGAWIGLSVDRSERMLVALLAIMKCGAVYVPLDPGYPRQRLTYMIEHANLSLLLTEQAFMPRWEGISSIVDSVALDRINLNQLPVEPVKVPVTPDDLCYVIYTSGSTGKPKGVQISHGALHGFIEAMKHRPGLEPSERLLAVTTLSFDIAALELFLPLCVGASVVIATRCDIQEGERLVSLMEEFDITTMQATPSTWQLLLQNNWQPKADFRALCGGEALPLSLARDLASRVGQLWNMYGPTEATVWALCYQVPVSGVPITLGEPNANIQAWVLDAELQHCPVGVPGELCLGGSGLMAGYHRDEKQTSSVLIDSPWSNWPGKLYRTGDLVKRLPNGEIQFLGRLDDQIKWRGFRIELGEIESVLADVEWVQHAVAVLLPLKENDQRLVLFWSGSLEAAVATRQLREACQIRLPHYMVPQHFVCLDRWPLTPNGKIDRRSLVTNLTWFQQGVSAGSRAANENIEDHAPKPPASDLDFQLADLWSEVLQVQAIGSEDDFFEMGGHSLLGTQLIAKVRDVFNVKLTLADLFAHPTLQSFSSFLGEEIAANSEVQGGSPKTPSSDETQSETLETERQLKKMGRSHGPLTIQQQRLWLLDEISEASLEYNLPAAFYLHGPLDVSALETAFTWLLDRHESLRTVIVTDPDDSTRALQQIVDVQPVTIEVRDFTATDVSIETMLEREKSYSFDLAKGPLWHVVLAKLDAEKHLLFFVVHHIVFDGWSFDILLRDLNTLYRTALQRQRLSQPDDSVVVEDVLPPLPLQYCDFALFQTQYLAQASEDGLQYWREQLVQPLPVLDLVTDFSRRPVQGRRGGSEPLIWESEWVEMLEEVARSKGVTLFMLILAAYYMLLHNYSGDEDIIVGAPTSGRQWEPVADLIGLFVNTLLFRVRIDNRLSFDEFLQQVSRCVVQAFEHQDTPFERLLEELDVKRDLSRSPLFQTMLMYQDVRNRNFVLGDLKIEQVPVARADVQTDLDFWCKRTADGLVGAFEYDVDLFRPETIQQMVAHLRLMLEKIAKDATKPLWSLSSGPLEPYRTFNETAMLSANVWHSEGQFPYNLLSSAGVHGDKIAVRCEAHSLDYRALEQQSDRWAYVIRQQIGLYEDELPDGTNQPIIGICLERTIDLLPILFGVLKAGAAYLPLDPGYPADRLTFMIEDSACRHVIVDNEALDHWAQQSDGGVNLYRPEKLQNRLDKVSLDVARSLIKRLSASEQAREQERMAYIIYTSGSTGVPKGVAVPLRAVDHFIRAMQDRPGLSRDHVLAAVTTLSFDISVLELLLPLSVGATLELVQSHYIADGHALKGVMERAQVNVLQATPATWQLLLDAAWQPTKGFKALVGGEAMSKHLADRLLDQGVELWNMYGPTETTVWSSCHRIESSEEVNILGLPIAGTRMFVLGEHQQILPVGSPGELCIAGKGVALGYFGRESLTAQRFVTVDQPQLGRVYRTGDLVSFTSLGSLKYHGRLDTQIKLRGFRIELGEIEQVLEQSADVEKAVVVLVDEKHEDRRLVAYYTVSAQLRSHLDMDRDQLRELLAKRLPNYMIPRIFQRIEQVPLTPSGKVDRKALVERYVVEQASAKVEERSDLDTQAQQCLAQIWQNVLGNVAIHKQDNFFDAGGHSLLAMRVISLAKEQYDVELTVRDLVLNTLEQLALLHEDSLTDARAPQSNELINNEDVAAREQIESISDLKNRWVTKIKGLFFK